MKTAGEGELVEDLGAWGRDLTQYGMGIMLALKPRPFREGTTDLGRLV